ncbi:protein-glutamate methylesterase/protein-glutamine glutaminase [Metabacillus iocasae]|uniref:Protein-glutamate methylesterase/protein-glutamine glutaminase n=1 Tax=Priestia iocasae TaxID=2291674 RepID=A0ABS2QR62_9BACI|nr:chemotaxis response regulator protein-glutamate methylesterase [Metabacillus iocasae]MBM7701885.1 two-component system chemotaxis response regulator CheB [Metabacillus iocasae]
MGKVKVLVVDDSAFMRKLISDFLESDGRFEVVSTARNGEDALEKMKMFHPDVITLDVEMPRMNGLEMLRQLMKEKPTPVVMLSSTTSEGAQNTVLAMEYGAIDFLAKPSGAISLDLYKVKETLIEKVLLASKANMKVFNGKYVSYDSDLKKAVFSYRNNSTIELKNTIQSEKVKTKKKIVCIGTSTGGPRALQEVLTGLPGEFESPIVIVQHMPPGFTKSLATRLNTLCSIHVKEAEHGELLIPGTAYIAPGGLHLTVKKIGSSVAVNLDEQAAIKGHRPSVDRMFESVGLLKDYEKIAVILTGMGSDGTEGLKKLKNSGKTKAIAESEETSVVYGMPKSAVATNLVDCVEPLYQISSVITEYVKK